MRYAALFALPCALFASTARAQTQPACMPTAWRAEPTSTSVQSAEVTANGAAVTFCVEFAESPTHARRCFTHTLATGAYASIAPAQAATMTVPLSPSVRPRPDGAEVCGVGSECQTVRLGRRVTSVSVAGDRRSFVAVSPDGSNLLAQTVALPSLRPGASFRVRVQSAEASRIELIEDRAMLFDCVDAGPGCTGSLLNPNGTRLAPVGGSTGALNVFSSSPVSLGNGLFAIADTLGNALLVQNARTGAVVRRVSAATSDNPEEGARLLHTNGTLVLVYAGARAGEVDTYDAATLTRRGHYALPACGR